jgi:hypothetical protein
MPEYHDIGNYRGYSIRVSPIGWRRFFPFRNWPYFVGDKVILSISTDIDVAEVMRNVQELSFYEVHADGHRVGQSTNDLKRGENDTLRLVSNTISRSGAFAIYLGTSISGHDSSIPIFTAEIMHRDSRSWDIFLVTFGALFGCVLSLILGILLGFIEIEKFWRVWIP